MLATDDFVRELPLASSRMTDQDQLLQSAWKAWQDDRYNIRPLIPYENAAILAEGKSISGAAPRLRQIGPDVPAVRFFGTDWMKMVNAGKAPVLPVSDFDAYVSDGYFKAIDDEPGFTEIGYCFKFGDAWYRVIYQRLLLPVRLEALKTKLIVSLTSELECRRVGLVH